MHSSKDLAENVTKSAKIQRGELEGWVKHWYVISVEWKIQSMGDREVIVFGWVLVDCANKTQ